MEPSTPSPLSRTDSKPDQSATVVPTTTTVPAVQGGDPAALVPTTENAPAAATSSSVADKKKAKKKAKVRRKMVNVSEWTEEEKMLMQSESDLPTDAPAEKPISIQINLEPSPDLAPKKAPDEMDRIIADMKSLISKEMGKVIPAATTNLSLDPIAPSGSRRGSTKDDSTTSRGSIKKGFVLTRTPSSIPNATQVQEHIIIKNRRDSIPGLTPYQSGKEDFLSMDVFSSKRMSILSDHGFVFTDDYGDSEEKPLTFKEKLMQAVNSSALARLKSEKKDKRKGGKSRLYASGAMYAKKLEEVPVVAKRKASVSEVQKKLQYLDKIRGQKGPEIRTRLPPCPKMLKNLVLWHEIPQVPLEVVVEKKLEIKERVRVAEEMIERGVCIGDEGWNEHVRKPSVDPRIQLAKLSDKMKKLLIAMNV